MKDAIETEPAQQFRSVVDKLAAQGVDTIFIMFALTEAAVTTACRDPDNAVVHLRGASAALSVAANGVSQRNEKSSPTPPAGPSLEPR